MYIRYTNTFNNLKTDQLLKSPFFSYENFEVIQSNGRERFYKIAMWKPAYDFVIKYLDRFYLKLVQVEM